MAGIACGHIMCIPASSWQLPGRGEEQQMAGMHMASPCTIPAICHPPHPLGGSGRDKKTKGERHGHGRKARGFCPPHPCTGHAHALAQNKAASHGCLNSTSGIQNPLHTSFQLSPHCRNESQHLAECQFLGSGIW